MPRWIIESLQQSTMNNHSILTLCKSLYKSATVGIRVNSLAISIHTALQIMQQHGIQCRVGQYAPDAIILLERVKLQDFPLYMNGSIEIQDEGSQLISLALNPESDWRILDYCAGAGGKTLHLAAMQQDQGEIISTDIEYSRLRELHFRSEKAQLRSIHLVSMQSKTSKDKKQKTLSYYKDACDAVLVDAPCTGMGTVRRMPMIKWRLEPKHVQKIVEKQSDILQKASEFVKPGGILIYATCSLLKEENGDIVHTFLQQNPDFLPDPLYHAYPQKTIEALEITKTQCDLSLLPSIHGTDGFFVSRMRRNE
jgi:16S rRNA (cytosine967-C5)-methyltransferase